MVKTTEKQENMKKILLLAIFGLANLFVQAQVAYDNKVVVEYINEAGELDSLCHYDMLPVYVDFQGSKGTVHDYNNVTGNEWVEEENKDCYVFVYPNKNMQWDKMKLELREYNSAIKRGVCLTVNSQPTISENVLRYDSNHDYYIYEGKDNATVCIDDVNYYGSVINVSGLNYNTTYHIRPFAQFSNGTIMYGGEKVYTTPRTIEGALTHEPEMSGWTLVYNNIIFKQEALALLTGGEIPEASSIKIYEHVFKTMLDEMNKEEMESTFKKNACRVLECTDGTLYFIDNLDDNIVADFKDSFHPTTVEFQINSLAVNLDIDNRGNERFTKSVNTAFNSIACDESWGVPYNSVLDIEPSSGSANPIVGFNIPGPLWNKTYSIYAVFVRISALDPEHVDDEESDKRPYRFYTNVIEQDEKGEYPHIGVRLTNPADGTNYFVTNAENLVDTLYLGDYHFNGLGSTIIQLQTQIPSRLTKDYSRRMLLSKIYLVPQEDAAE